MCRLVLLRSREGLSERKSCLKTILVLHFHDFDWKPCAFSYHDVFFFLFFCLFILFFLLCNLYSTIHCYLSLGAWIYLARQFNGVAPMQNTNFHTSILVDEICGACGAVVSCIVNKIHTIVWSFYMLFTVGKDLIIQFAMVRT